MTNPTAIAQIDFSPIPGKRYWNSDREWREEFVYFLMVDRFHDNNNRSPDLTPARSTGSGTQTELKKFCGGTIFTVQREMCRCKNIQMLVTQHYSFSWN